MLNVGLISEISKKGIYLKKFSCAVNKYSVRQLIINHDEAYFHSYRNF